MKILTIIDRAFLLKKTPLFAELDLDLLLSIADKMTTLHLQPGEVIFKEEQEAQRMYFIVKGSVLVMSAELQPGTFFGEESLFNDEARSYCAVAQIPTTLLTLSKTHLFSIIFECPSVALGLLNIYTSTFKCRMC